MDFISVVAATSSAQEERGIATLLSHGFGANKEDISVAGKTHFLPCHAFRLDNHSPEHRHFFESIDIVLAKGGIFPRAATVVLADAKDLVGR